MSLKTVSIPNLSMEFKSHSKLQELQMVTKLPGLKRCVYRLISAMLDSSFEQVVNGSPSSFKDIQRFMPSAFRQQPGLQLQRPAILHSNRTYADE